MAGIGTNETVGRISRLAGVGRVHPLTISVRRTATWLSRNGNCNGADRSKVTGRQGMPTDAL